MPVIRPKTPDYGPDFVAYNGLVDCADVHGWATYLGVTEKGWWLEVRDRRELLARSVSWVLADAAVACGLALVKSGRLR